MTPDSAVTAPAARHVPGGPDGTRGHRSRLRRVGIPLLVVAALLVAGRLFVAQPYVIPSDSMEPTLQTGDQILVETLDPSHVDRGDLVVFDARAFGGDGAYVKRVIGVGGDEVACCGQDGRLTLNGTPVDEPYLMPGDAPSALHFDVRVPDGRLWVMGDHRSDSGDSRAHLGDPGGGMVSVDDVIGRVAWRYWPPSEAGSVSGQAPVPAAGEEQDGTDRPDARQGEPR